MRDEAIVRRIVKRHLGRHPRRMKALGGGLNNRVFRIETQGPAHVVRLNSDPEKLADYQKEEWAMDQARKVGVPTARVLEVGLEDKRPFMILEEAQGIPGTHWGDSAGVMRELGKYAARIHRIRSQGFGRAVGSAAPGPLWQRWAEFLDNELCGCSMVTCG